jgi:hypothetical protein
MQPPAVLTAISSIISRTIEATPVPVYLADPVE